MDKFITTLNNILHIAVTVAGIALLIIVYHWASAAYRPPVVTQQTQSSMQTIQGVQQAALQSSFHLPAYQAKDLAQQVSNPGKPTTTTMTTGSEWDKLSKQYAQKVKSDFSVVTNPGNGKITPTTPVQLNQYNMYAYPKIFFQVGYAPGNEAIVSVSYKVLKTPWTYVYLGPYGRFDLIDSKRSTIGVMATFMLTK